MSDFDPGLWGLRIRAAAGLPNPRPVREIIWTNGPVTPEDIAKFEEAAQRSTPLDFAVLDGRLRSD